MGNSVFLRHEMVVKNDSEMMELSKILMKSVFDYQPHDGD